MLYNHKNAGIKLSIRPIILRNFLLDVLYLVKSIIAKLKPIVPINVIKKLGELLIIKLSNFSHIKLKPERPIIGADLKLYNPYSRIISANNPKMMLVMHKYFFIKNSFLHIFISIIQKFIFQE